MKGGTPKGHLDLLLLAVLSDRELHGYAVIEALKAHSDGVFDLPEGTVYPALHRLEREKFVDSFWDSSAARRRRCYRLTNKGQAELTRERAEWQSFSRAVLSVVGP